LLESLAPFAPGLEITKSQAELVLVESNPVARAAREPTGRDQLRTAVPETDRIFEVPAGFVTSPLSENG
jgi:hypothetical protein